MLDIDSLNGIIFLPHPAFQWSAGAACCFSQDVIPGVTHTLSFTHTLLAQSSTFFHFAVCLFRNLETVELLGHMHFSLFSLLLAIIGVHKIEIIVL